MRSKSIIGECLGCCVRTEIPPPTVNYECMSKTVGFANETLCGWTPFYPGINSEYPGGFWSGGTRKYRTLTQGGWGEYISYLGNDCAGICRGGERRDHTGSHTVTCAGETNGRQTRFRSRNDCGAYTSDVTGSELGLVYGGVGLPKCGTTPSYFCQIQTQTRREVRAGECVNSGSYSTEPVVGMLAYNQLEDEVLFGDVGDYDGNLCCSFSSVGSTTWQPPQSKTPIVFKSGSTSVVVRFYGTGQPNRQYRITYHYTNPPGGGVDLEMFVETDANGEYDVMWTMPQPPVGSDPWCFDTINIGIS